MLPTATEEIALPLRGKKRNLTPADLLEYFGHERLNLRPAVIDDVMATLREVQTAWDDLIAASFLPRTLQDAYRELVQTRRRRLFGDTS